MGRPRLEIKGRIERRLDVTGDCWTWTGTCDRHGYGKISIWDGGRGYTRQRFVHILYFVACGGIIPAGYELDHLCRNPPCARPAHLEPVTHRENLRRGMSPSAIANRAGTCVRGHPRTEETVYHKPGSGKRECRICALDSQRRYKKVKAPRGAYGPRG